MKESSKNQNLNEIKEDKREMKIQSHKFDYLKMELKCLHGKVVQLLVSDISRARARDLGRNSYLHREFCVLS